VRAARRMRRLGATAAGRGRSRSRGPRDVDRDGAFDAERGVGEVDAMRAGRELEGRDGLPRRAAAVDGDQGPRPGVDAHRAQARGGGVRGRGAGVGWTRPERAPAIARRRAGPIGGGGVGGERRVVGGGGVEGRGVEEAWRRGAWRRGPRRPRDRSSRPPPGGSAATPRARRPAPRRMRLARSSRRAGAEPRGDVGDGGDGSDGSDGDGAGVVGDGWLIVDASASIDGDAAAVAGGGS
jgi:hypothetical protein